MVARERGRCPVLGSAYRWQFEQAQRGRGILVFDGWHKRQRPVALRAGRRGPRLDRQHRAGARRRGRCPTTIVWEHANGVRGVWDVTAAADMCLRSDYDTNDER